MPLQVMPMVMLQRSSYRKLRDHQSGLTLIEVLVALAIIAIALTAIIKSTSENIRGTAYLQDKTIAMYVAEQVLNEKRLGLLPQITSTMNNQTEMLGKTWYWQVEENTTNNPRIKKETVKVFRHSPDSDDASSIVTMEGFVYAKEK